MQLSVRVQQIKAIKSVLNYYSQIKVKFNNIIYSSKDNITMLKFDSLTQL